MSDKLKIFLSGGMTGLTEEEASGWRTSFKLKNIIQDDTAFIFIDPTYYYFTTDKTTQEYEKEAMEYDLYWVKHSDLIIVNFNSLSSIGTAQEIMLAYTLNKPIIGMIEEDKYDQLHPWYKEECIKIFKYKSDKLEDIINEIIEYIWRFKND
jgi:nucleoside 2-deoxyribosyltransferase